MANKQRVATWVVTDDFWAKVGPLLPIHERSPDKHYERKAGGGRKPKTARLIFEAIVYVLRTGCQWKALPRVPFGSASAVHKRFLEWESAGVFEAIWAAGLAEYDSMEGIAWCWQSIASNKLKAALTQERIESNPTDQVGGLKLAPSAGRRAWRPLVVHRNFSKSA
jgi:transposase